MSKQKKSSNVVWHAATVTRARREQQNGHRGGLFWFTGLSGAGKSTLAHSVEEKLHRGFHSAKVTFGTNTSRGMSLIAFRKRVPVLRTAAVRNRHCGLPYYL